jgi:hypothetical protein
MLPFMLEDTTLASCGVLFKMVVFGLVLTDGVCVTEESRSGICCNPQ